MLLPPLFAGGVKATDPDAFPDVATPIVGAPGRPGMGTKVFDAADAGPVPTAFVAVTVHVYVLPLSRFDTSTGLAEPVPDLAVPPFDDTHDAVYPVTLLPPLFAGPVKATDPDAFPRVATPIVGAPGTVAGTKVFDAADAGPVPTPFVAV